MPITLGCPTCAKRFRARDESVGKRVKCPYCQAAIVVNADGTGAASGPTDVLPSNPPSRPTLPASASAARPVTPGDWGGDSGGFVPKPASSPALGGRGTTGPQSKPALRSGASSTRLVSKPNADAKSPRQLALPHWKKTKSGLFWVLFGLVFLAIPGFVEFGKLVYERSVGNLPDGPGVIQIEGYVNTNDKDSIKLSKRDELNVLLYGVPVLIGGLALTLGRLTAGAAPRASGAKGLFAFSGLFTLVALAGVITYAVCDKLFFVEVGRYVLIGMLVAAGLAEVWFLTGLATVGSHLKRPRAPRAVGFLWFVAGLGVLVATIGWEQYLKELRPKPVDADTVLYEAGARMLGCIVLVGVYWRAVRATRAAILEWIDAVDE